MTTAATIAGATACSPLTGRLGRLVDAPRISGLDIARALAVLGMIGAHVAAIPEFTPRDPLSYLSIVHGSSSILFALLAGISVALMTGRTRVLARAELPRMRLKIAGRAAVIFLIGLLLELTGTTIVVILPFFGALFLIALPFLAWSPRRLFWTAVAMGVLGPPLVQLVMHSALLPPATVGIIGTSTPQEAKTSSGAPEGSAATGGTDSASAHSDPGTTGTDAWNAGPGSADGGSAGPGSPDAGVPRPSPSSSWTCPG